MKERKKERKKESHLGGTNDKNEKKKKKIKQNSLSLQFKIVPLKSPSVNKYFLTFMITRIERVKFHGMIFNIHLSLETIHGNNKYQVVQQGITDFVYD